MKVLTIENLPNCRPGPHAICDSLSGLVPDGDCLAGREY